MAPNRQKSGAACVRCRAKKLKCDGWRPRCGTCIRSNVDCEPAAAQVHRGPKKGYLKELQGKIATLEQQLAEAHGLRPTTAASGPASPQPDHTPPFELDFLSMDPGMADVSGEFYPTQDHDYHDASSSELSPNPLGPPVWTGMVPTPPSATGPVTTGSISADPISAGSVLAGPVLAGPISANNFAPAEVRAIPAPATAEPFSPTTLLQSDLDQVYFERTHPSVPILHRRQYFSWARSPNKTPAQTCLQYAMWTSAASRSSHLQPLQESLYETTQRLLAAASNDPSNAAIEYVQAHILISIHTFVHRSHRQGWISAGQCFRMVQLMRLHQLDDPLQAVEHDDHDRSVRIEEMRRAFWMAYCVDVLVSKRGQWPLTLHEHVRATRLPLPDDAFQNDEHHKMQYLHELLEIPAELNRSPFLELITFCTISRNIASLKRNRLEGRDSVIPTHDLFSHHSRLSSTLDLRTEALKANYPSSQLTSDPILLFTRMFANALALCLCSCLKKTLPADVEDCHGLVMAWQHRAWKSVFGMVDLAGSIASLSYFKMHPFTPLPLGICRDFLDGGQWVVDHSTEPQMQELSNLLHDMSSINNVAQDYLDDRKSQSA